jgi:four helix bundle protein
LQHNVQRPHWQNVTWGKAGRYCTPLLITNYELRITTANNELSTMKTENVLQQKSFAFAIRIVNAYKYIAKQHGEYVLSKQLLRCGTSIGANVEESIGAQSKADFISKLSIAYKETRETIYWINLLHATGYLDDEQKDSILEDANELAKIIGKIQITLKNKGFP